MLFFSDCLVFIPCFSLSLSLAVGRKAFSIFYFVLNQLPEAAPGLGATGICQEPKLSPKAWIVVPHSLAFSPDIYASFTKSAALWTWSPSTSSRSCCHSLGQATVTSGCIPPVISPLSSQRECSKPDLITPLLCRKLSVAFHRSGGKSASALATPNTVRSPSPMLRSLNLNTCPSLCLQLSPHHLIYFWLISTSASGLGQHCILAEASLSPVLPHLHPNEFCASRSWVTYHTLYNCMFIVSVSPTRL